MLLKVFSQIYFKWNRIWFSWGSFKYAQNWVKRDSPCFRNSIYKNVIIAPGQGKKPVSILNDEFCEEQAFSYLPRKGKFGYIAPRDIPISPTRYFNQRLLDFNQYFASDADYIFFARSVYDQHHFCSSINFAMHKIKPGTLTAGTVKSNCTIERFVARDNAFSFMSSVKGAPAYWKQILYYVLAMVKPTFY